MNIYTITIDKKILNEYKEYYFKLYPKRKIFPFKNPLHPSINQWTHMKNVAMNRIKQLWNDFIIWVVNKYGYSNLNIEKCELYLEMYFDTKRRHDSDNYVPKFINDGLIQSHMIVDDDFGHITKLTISGDYDKYNTRMVIKIITE